MIVERLIKKTQDGTIGKSTDDPWPNDDMAVNVGDTHTNYYQQPAPASSGISTLGKIAVAASLVAGGAGIGTLIPAAIDLLSQDKQPNQAEAPIGQNPDSDTKYGLRLFTDPPTQ